MLSRTTTLRFVSDLCNRFTKQTLCLLSLHTGFTICKVWTQEYNTGMTYQITFLGF